MRFKPGVCLEDLKPQTGVALGVCNDAYKSFGCEMTVTSVKDGRHMLRSKHYEGRAFDLRIKDVPKDLRRAVVETIKLRLGHVGFDVVWEGVGKPSEHVHVEYDFK
jgi:uncharacterized protein YcbK (DUF882 family)